MAVMEETQKESQKRDSFEEIEKKKSKLFHSKKEAFHLFGIKRSLRILLFSLAAGVLLLVFAKDPYVRDQGGEVISEEVLDLKAPKAGFLTHLALREGELVEEGEILLTVKDPEDLERSLELEREETRIRAGLSDLLSKRFPAFHRFQADEMLFKERAIPEDDARKTKLEFEALERERARLRAELELLDRKRLLREKEKEREIVRAPFQGTVISDLGAKEGSYVTRGETLLTLASETHLIEFLLREEDYGRVEPRMRARVSFYAFPGKKFEGEVIRLKHYAESLNVRGLKTRAVKVLIRVEGLPQEVRNGMSARVAVRARALSFLDMIRRKL